MGDDMKAGDNKEGCGCGKSGCNCGAGGCPCGAQKCCCKKAICSLVLLLIGGIIGYFAGSHCAYSRCHYQQMMCPMGVVATTPADVAPSKK